jgi:hypothetical protein
MMRAPYNYGLPGDVSYSPQNRILEDYFGNAPNARLERTMEALPSGSYMAAIGKTVPMNGMRGLDGLYAIPLSEVTGTPVMRAAYEMGRLGCGTGIGMAALGDAAADRAACQATTGALVGGAGIATGVHQGNTPAGGTADAGWTAGLGIFSAIASTANAMCGLIQGAGAVTSAPPGPTPPPLPPATSSLPSGYSAAPDSSPSSGVMGGVPNWAIAAGAAVAGALVAGMVFGRK